MPNTKRTTTQKSKPLVTIAFKRTFLDGEMDGASVYIKRRASRATARKLIADESNIGMEENGNPVLDLFIHECSPDTDLLVIERDLLSRENAILAREIERREALGR